MLRAYDDTPDGKMDKKEFVELVKDIESERQACLEVCSGIRGGSRP